MVDKQFTLLELHLHGNPKFSPKAIAPFGSDRSSEGDEEASAAEPSATVDEKTGDESASARGAKVLIGVLALASMAAVVKYLRDNGDGIDTTEYEPPTDREVDVTVERD